MPDPAIDLGTPAAPTATPSAPQAATPPASVAPVATTPLPGTPAPAISAPEDRSGWVPSYRIREAREAAQRAAEAQWTQREAALKAETERYRQQLHSLVGVTPPGDPEVKAVRDQFGNLYPGLSKLEARAEAVLANLERQGDQESQVSHYWQSYGRQTMDRLFEKAATSLGSPLSDEGKRALHSSFVGFVQSSPEMADRYANDPTLIEDFWKAFTASFIDPARRAAQANVVGRAATIQGLPTDAPGGVPRATPAPTMGSLDERANAAWQMYQQTSKG